MAFVHGHGPLQWSAAGKAELKSGRPPLPFDRWRIASVTKPFVSVVMLQLVEEGKIGLDDLLLRLMRPRC